MMLPVIDLTYKTITTPREPGGSKDVFMMWFVYSPVGNFLIKGGAHKISQYMKDNFNVHGTPYFANRVTWHNGKLNSSWAGCKGMGIIYNVKKKYEFFYYDYNNCRHVIKTFRRIPKKWVPELDEFTRWSRKT